MSEDVKISVQQATMVISEMRSRGVISEAMPETDEAKVALALKIAKFAKQSYESGNTGDDVQVVINILSTDSPSAPEPPVEVEEPQGATTPTEPEESPQEPPAKPQAVSGGASTDTEIAGEIEARVSGFPVPEMIPDPGPFPADLTKLSMSEIRKLAGEWNRVFGSATWNLSMEQSNLLFAEQVWESKRGKALKGIERKGEDGKAKLAAAIEAEIASDPEVADWKERVTRHQSFVTMFKGLVRIYEANIERLSREITARMNEDGSNKLSERKT